MIPLVDVHVHLLGGLDDGPESLDEAMQMCRIMAGEGVRHATALAHQNDGFPAATAERIRQSAAELQASIKAEGVDIQVYPSAEVMARPDIVEAYQRGELVTLGDQGKYLLVEQPHFVFVDLLPTALAFRQLGVTMVLAHPERNPEWLHEPGAIEALIEAGCLVQVSANALVMAPSARDERAIRDWAKRGIIHLLGSDGHSPSRRPPRLRMGYEQLIRWLGPIHADRVASINGLALFQGLPVIAPPPGPRSRSWFHGWFKA